MDIFIRCLFAFALVAATANPTNFSFMSWAMDNYQTQMPIVALMGLLLFSGWIIFVRASVRALGVFGMCLVGAIFAALVWVLFDQDWLSTTNRAATEWLAIVGLSVVLGTGLSWSLIRRRMSGQIDVDDVDNR
ncbi:DUF6524 family protein [Pseudoruegeria sp. SK021]|uniref:DUF6524 family protein n=1 Tax=Pseudoruegeria sp. SK021 TaxID=1933035 RepID=UPI000A21AA64|nr:DUF6524 family protein [Pseudoruegeria sp. SK021]OSP56706.1 hypothetical protein BV911_01785 [Pseudoruegeria sp. SK021]